MSAWDVESPSGQGMRNAEPVLLAMRQGDL
jgi:hypothetical protein